MDNYFIISNSDGDTTVNQMNKQELVEALSNDEGEEGTSYWGAVDFVKNLNENDTNYWGGDILIIKGNIVVPKPKEVITSYAL